MTTAVAFVLLAFDSHEVVLILLIAVIGIANGPLSVAMFSLRQRATGPFVVRRAFAVSMNLNFVWEPVWRSRSRCRLLTHSVPLDAPRRRVVRRRRRLLADGAPGVDLRTRRSGSDDRLTEGNAPTSDGTGPTATACLSKLLVAFDSTDRYGGVEF